MKSKLSKCDFLYVGYRPPPDKGPSMASGRAPRPRRSENAVYVA
jgi:hypothetical protein